MTETKQFPIGAALRQAQDRLATPAQPPNPNAAPFSTNKPPLTSVRGSGRGANPESRPSLLNLHQLDPRAEALAIELLHRATRHLGFEMTVVDVLRTPAEQARNIKNGVSWTSNSLHLPQPCCGKSHAIDLAPGHLMKLKNWAPWHPDWTKLGELGESLGFRWGGRWKKKRDCPHFEWHVPKESTA